MTFRQYSPRELRDALDSGRIIEFVPKPEIHARRLDAQRLSITWPNGPKGHALIGLCSEGCHFLAEYPAQWRTRGHAIAAAIPWPHPDLIRKFASEDRTA